MKTSVNSKIIFPDIWSVFAYTVTYRGSIPVTYLPSAGADCGTIPVTSIYLVLVLTVALSL